jgi:hypothetical protein
VRPTVIFPSFSEIAEAVGAESAGNSFSARLLLSVTRALEKVFDGNTY